jgi:outer membrane protein OmpA-like peptidoglycan-associated protein
MIRGLGALTVMLVLAAAAHPQRSAADPTYKTKILDLVFHVEDMSGKTQSMSGQTQNMSGNTQNMSGNVQNMDAKIQNMVGQSKDMAVKQSRTEVRIELASDVLFDFDSAEIQPKARQTLARIAQFIGGSAKGQVRIFGYTDGKGSATYNQGLSERRAQSVKRWFIDKDGLRKVDFATQGFGARNPVAPNTKPDGSDNPGGRKKNRRVEIVIHK